MTKLFLAAGVAALAITTPAASQPGDRGGGKDRGAQVKKAERGGKARAQRAERRDVVKQRSKAREQRAERVSRVREQRAERAEKIRENRAELRERTVERRVELRERARDRRADRIEARRELALRNQPRDWTVRGRARGWDDFYNCPRGLAKKPVPCVPPGQVKNVVGQPVRALSDRVELRQLPNRLRSVYADTDRYYYRYGSGYAYRVNRTNNVVSALLPLFGLGLTAGQPFPSAYSNYYMPTALQSFYPNTPYTSYRYANGYVYQIDPITGLIEDVDPLLGYGYGYGQMMPATYSAYNLPYQYRPLYADTANSYYRYAPGAIYQVDPQTSLITSVAALLGGGMTIGQPLPMGYSAYNVPMGYRSNYYDRPDAWYRYSNGNIYQVDPTTQLVTALVASILT